MCVCVRVSERVRELSQEFLCRVSNFSIRDMVNVTRTAQFCFDILLVTKFIAALIIPLPFACMRIRTELPNRKIKPLDIVLQDGIGGACASVRIVCKELSGPLAPLHSPLETFGMT